jgi:uncharacterized protein (TIGR03067 family)
MLLVLRVHWRMIAVLAAVIVVAAAGGGLWYYYEVAWYYQEHDQELITCDQYTLFVLKEQDRLQGNWECHRINNHSAVFIYADTWKSGTNDFKPTNIGHFRLDPRKRPKQIDWIDRYGAVSNGIYELEGDTFTVCFGKRRPTAMPVIDSADMFVGAKEYGDYSVSVYTRIEEKKKKQ